MPAFSNARSRRPARRCRPGRRRACARLHDRFVCRAAALLPRRDIGSLAVNGTVNDLAMCGARPLYLSAGFILEEGLPMDDLWQVVQSMRGRGEHGRRHDRDRRHQGRGPRKRRRDLHQHVGHRPRGSPPGVASIQRGPVPATRILLSGDIGSHGIAIMAVREGLEFETTIESDSRPSGRHGRLDPRRRPRASTACGTPRGAALASALNEIAASAHPCEIRIEEDADPGRRGGARRLRAARLRPALRGERGALYRVRPAERCGPGARAPPEPRGLAGRGELARCRRRSGIVIRTRLGTPRIIDMISGEQLPRIC